MAVVVASSRARAEQARLQWQEQESRSPEMAAPPRPPRPRPARAAVVYYLSRNGHLEHPHFMEVLLSCPDGLYLRDVIDRLDALRGKGMARMYSWASKRSYRNGFVWHDLADDDLIHPVVGREYVLKGTERLHPVPLPLLDAAVESSSTSCGLQETATSSSSASWGHGRPSHRKKSASACGPAEIVEYIVYKGEERAADAATQTEDSGRGRRHQRSAQAAVVHDELSRAETSPPTASTSPETLEALIKADGRVVAAVSGSGRARASSVLMQLVSCGSVSVKGAHASPVMPRAHHRARPPRPTASSAVAAAEVPAYRAKIVEDKEYFSGSIVEMPRRSPADDASQDLAVLRRSSSYNADRVIKLELAKEAGDLHDRCIPRKPKSKKDGYMFISGKGIIKADNNFVGR
ncbi:protein SOSEKI 4-like [Phragmites australis]|uniref:protein SOSEKI 4-like n=1 Tax=Phragmites australis TaxID=29695 RepID=UPI002D764F50|nr:protein SOSEKI 4-like [Phragmites australis]